MPPKKAAKAQEKSRQKVVEDKTFGLKNKKGKKQQQYIEKLKKNTQGSSKEDKKRQAERAEKQRAAEALNKERAMMNNLFKPVAQKVNKGEDPKSVVCAFFLKGTCKKGDKCKFSHDATKGRKGAKRNIYADDREGDEKKDDTMDGWDQAKLEEVVNKKHGAAAKTNATQIICKHFLKALEKELYGWFWVCPNGGDDCQYRHALPKGYVLKRDKKAMEEQEERITIEELVEKERAALGDHPKLTLETFLAWKKKKVEEKKKALAKVQKAKKKKLKDGQLNSVSGRDLFTYNPELAGDDDDSAVDSNAYANKKDGALLEVEAEAEAEKKKISEKPSDDAEASVGATAADPAPPAANNTNTESAQEKSQDAAAEQTKPEPPEPVEPEPEKEETPEKEDAPVAAVPIDASLFAGEDLPDFDDDDDDDDDDDED